MIKFIASLFTHKFELVQDMCKLVQRMTQTNQIIASLFSNKFKLFKTCINYTWITESRYFFFAFNFHPWEFLSWPIACVARELTELLRTVINVVIPHLSSLVSVLFVCFCFFLFLFVSFCMYTCGMYTCGMYTSEIFWRKYFTRNF